MSDGLHFSSSFFFHENLKGGEQRRKVVFVTATCGGAGVYIKSFMVDAWDSKKMVPWSIVQDLPNVVFCL